MTTPPDADEGADRVDVWVIPTDRPAPVVRRLRRLLDHTEPDRAGAGQDRERSDRFTVVHGAVRLLTSDRLGTLPAAPEWRQGPHGKPEPVADGSRLLLTLWCRREACVKAYGGRLVQGPRYAADRPGPAAAGRRRPAGTRTVLGPGRTRARRVPRRRRGGRRTPVPAPVEAMDRPRRPPRTFRPSLHGPLNRERNTRT